MDIHYYYGQTYKDHPFAKAITSNDNLLCEICINQVKNKVIEDQELLCETLMYLIGINDKELFARFVPHVSLNTHAGRMGDTVLSYIFATSDISDWEFYAKMCLEYGANINLPCLKRGTTPFLYACRGQCEYKIKWLVNHGANVHAKNNIGENALHATFNAVMSPSNVLTNIVKYLLDRGVDPREKTITNETVFEYPGCSWYMKKIIRTHKKFCGHKFYSIYYEITYYLKWIF